MKKIKIFLITMVVAALAIIFMPIGVSAYTLSYDANGGTGTMDSIQVTGSKCLTNKNNFTAPEGKVFVGWSFTENALKKDIITNCFDVEEDKIVYAVWFTKVSEANAIITEPVGGELPDITLESGDNTKYTVGNVYGPTNASWYIGTSSTLLDNNTKFIAGDNYTLNVWFRAAEGYSFTNDTVFKINDNTITGEFTTGNSLFVRSGKYTFTTKTPTPKTKITELRFTGPEIREGNIIPSTINVETVPANAFTSNTVQVKWFKSDTGTDDVISYILTGTSITGNFEEGKYYIFNNFIPISINPEFEMGDNLKCYYNEIEMTSFNNNNIIFTWLEAKEAYTYKYLFGDNQEFNKGKISSYTFRIDGEYNKFESLKIGDLSLIKGTDYIVTEGSTIITFTKQGITKLNKLTTGIYNVEIRFTGNIATGKLIINEENPNTKDNIISNIILSSISLISLISISLYLSKNNKLN